MFDMREDVSSTTYPFQLYIYIYLNVCMLVCLQVCLFISKLEGMHKVLVLFMLKYKNSTLVQYSPEAGEQKEELSLSQLLIMCQILLLN